MSIVSCFNINDNDYIVFQIIVLYSIYKLNILKLFTYSDLTVFTRTIWLIPRPSHIKCGNGQHNVVTIY